MDAVSIAAPKQIEIVDIPVPRAGPEDVLVDIHYAGLCGTDLNTYRGLMPLVSYPRIPGHELSGTVVATGAQVPASIRAGDRVVRRGHGGLADGMTVVVVDGQQAAVATAAPALAGESDS